VAPPDQPGEPGALKVRLADEMRAAMKARERVRLGALRLLATSVKNREVELRHTLSDEEFIEIANREIKRRREAIEAYDKAGRSDRAAQEREEREVLESYVPAGLSQQEIEALVDEAIAASGAAAPGDMGRVMGLVMAKAKGRVDGKAAQALVRARLEGEGTTGP
jgi:uncharacterized protein YqeY